MAAVNEPGAPLQQPQPQTEPQVEAKPTDLLAQIPPGSEAHKQLVAHINKKLVASESKVNEYYSNWIRSENAYYAYLNRDSKTRAAWEANNRGEAPEVTDIQVPYCFATVNTIMSYFLATFCSRERTFTLKGYSAKDTKNAQNMERMLQIELESTRYERKFNQFFQDALIYGQGVMKALWETQTKPEVRVMNGQRVKFDSPYHEGTTLENIDPYKFFPDPRVPVCDVAEKGEFVFWRELRHSYELSEAEAMGQLIFTDQIKGDALTALSSDTGQNGLNQRNKRWGSTNLDSTNVDLKGMVTLHQGTITLDPKDFGLKDQGLRVQKYLVTLANKTTIIQLEPFDAWHGMHPVVVCEPYSQGYEFMSPGCVEYIADFQQLLSWVENSRMWNVRSTLNGSLVINPNMVNVADVGDKTPGKAIRLLPQAQGQPIDNAIKSLTVPDVTANHTVDLRNIGYIGDNASGVNDVIRGNDSVGDQTATEVNTKQNNATNRLASIARVISSQAFAPLADLMIMNRQQHMTIPIELDDNQTVLGVDSFTGAFRFIVHDGTLPQARQQEVNALREVMQLGLQDPGLAQMYDMRGIFEEIASMSGLDMRAYRLTEEQIAERRQQAQQQSDPAADAELVKMQNDIQREIIQAQAKLQQLELKGQLDAAEQQRKHDHEMAIARLEAMGKQLEADIKAGVDREKILAQLAASFNKQPPAQPTPTPIADPRTRLQRRIAG